MMLKTRLIAFAVFFSTSLVGTGASMAQAPEDWQLGLQDSHSPTMDRILSLNDIMFWICIAICVVVMGLMLYIFVRFNRKRNPTPQKFTHNSLIEVLWTVIPVIVLVAIAIPSFRLL